jgi:peptide/nickel transport system substrate-binding protein
MLVRIVCILLLLCNSILIGPALLEARGNQEGEQPVRFKAGYLANEPLHGPRTPLPWEQTTIQALLWQLVYDQLWMIGPAPDYEPIPRIATRWESEDRKTWTFHLRNDVFFHNGSRCTAEDVAASLQKARTADIDTITIMDAFTLQVTLSGPHPDTSPYPPFYHIPIVSEDSFAEGNPLTQLLSQAKAGNGSGPYTVETIDGKGKITLQAFPRYWDRKPEIDTLVFTPFQQERALASALKQGSIAMQGYSGIPHHLVSTFRNTEGCSRVQNPGLELCFMSYNLAPETPLRDIAVRRAIAHAIDRKTLIQEVYHGYALPIDTFLYPEHELYKSNLPRYTYHPYRAVRMLESSGYVDTDLEQDGIRNDPNTGKNLCFTLLLPDDPQFLHMAELIVEQVKEIGIDIELEPKPAASFYRYVRDGTSSGHDMLLYSLFPGPHLGWIWEMVSSPGEQENGGRLNTAFYGNEEVDSLVEAMGSEPSQTEYRKHAHRIQQIVSEELPYLFLVRPIVIDIVPVSGYTGYTSSMGGLASRINPWTYYLLRPKQ